MASKKLLVVGELNIDLILNDISGFPEIGTEIVAADMNFTLGSSSAILASNISTLGVETFFCGMVGDDDFGTYVLQQLENKNVNTQYISKSSREKTGITVVMNYEQDRANVTYCGAMDLLTIHEIPWQVTGKFDHLHLSNYFLQKGIKKDITEIFKKAKSAGLTTSLDLQWDPENKWDFDYKSCLPYVDIFFPNEAELMALTKETDIEAALKSLRPYINIIALKRGNKGSRVFSSQKDIIAKPFLNKEFSDAIGAGDSFNAGFLEKFLEGASLAECLKNGNLTGSLSTLKPGGTGAFTSREEVGKLKTKILNQQS